MISVTLFDRTAAELSCLSDEELTQLQYEQEKLFANAIKSGEPFSESRAEITKTAYATIDKFVDERNSREGKSAAYGADAKLVNFLKNVIARLGKSDRKLRFFEAGVGTGYILDGLSDLSSVELDGCDAYINETLKEKYPSLKEDSIYRALDLVEDESLDIFYSNDVLEHLPEDEVDALFEKVYRKLAPGGIVITITPSRYTGPHDITRLADPGQLTAKGLHLHEYTYRELTDLLGCHQFKIGGVAFKNFKKNISCAFGCVGTLNSIKRGLDRLFARPSFRKFSGYMHYFCMGYVIAKK